MLVQLRLEQLLTKYTPEPYRQALISLLTLTRAGENAEMVDLALAVEALRTLKAHIRQTEGLDDTAPEPGPF